MFKRITTLLMALILTSYIQADELYLKIGMYRLYVGESNNIEIDILSFSPQKNLAKKIIASRNQYELECY